jgi:hypothetical protein
MIHWIALLLVITFATALLSVGGAFEGGLRFILALPLVLLAAAIVASRTIVHRDPRARPGKGVGAPHAFCGGGAGGPGARSCGWRRSLPRAAPAEARG